MNTLPAGTSSSQGRCQDVAHDTRAINACLHWSPESCRHACLWSYESVLLSHGSNVVKRGLCRQHPARVPFPPVTPVHASQRPTPQPPRVTAATTVTVRRPLCLLREWARRHYCSSQSAEHSFLLGGERMTFRKRALTSRENDYKLGLKTQVRNAVELALQRDATLEGRLQEQELCAACGTSHHES